MSDNAGLRAGRQTQMEAYRARAQARLEDTEFLLAHGVHVEQICARVGFPSPAAADTFFRRQGRPDIAIVFNLHRKHERQAA